MATYGKIWTFWFSTLGFGGTVLDLLNSMSFIKSFIFVSILCEKQEAEYEFKISL